MITLSLRKSRTFCFFLDPGFDMPFHQSKPHVLLAKKFGAFSNLATSSISTIFQRRSCISNSKKTWQPWFTCIFYLYNFHGFWGVLILFLGDASKPIQGVLVEKPRRKRNMINFKKLGGNSSSRHLFVQIFGGGLSPNNHH